MRWPLRERRRVCHEAEARLHALVHNSSDVIVVVSSDSTILYEAGSVAAVLGRRLDEVHGARLSDWVDSDDVPLLLTLCNTVGHEDAEVRLRHPDGVVATCEVRATSLLEDPGWKGVVLHIWDVSDRKALELELRLAQKLEAVGQLAAGIAHEINTPIQYVGDSSRFLDNAFAELVTVLDAYSELLAAAQRHEVTDELVTRVEEAEEIADVEYLRQRIPGACERMVDGVHSVSKIVSAMRAFAHPPSLEMSRVDINEAVENTLIVATGEYKYVADLTTELGDLPLVECNAGDINQVLINLIVNAGQAVADVVGDSGRRGSIHIRTRATRDAVLISVADTGGGIAPGVAERIFDPFFTTKEVGRGTGQGLTLSRTMVVDRHHGTLTFESRPGEGTTFCVHLPVGATRAADQPVAAADQPVAAAHQPVAAAYETSQSPPRRRPASGPRAGDRRRAGQWPPLRRVLPAGQRPPLNMRSALFGSLALGGSASPGRCSRCGLGGGLARGLASGLARSAPRGGLGSRRLRGRCRPPCGRGDRCTELVEVLQQRAVGPRRVAAQRRQRCGDVLIRSAGALAEVRSHCGECLGRVVERPVEACCRLFDFFTRDRSGARICARSTRASARRRFLRGGHG